MAGNASNDVSLLAGHPRAEFVGGRRVSQPSDHTPLKKDQESATVEDENDPEKQRKEMILQKQLDNERLKALKESQQHQFQNTKQAAIEKNTQPFNPVKNNHIRQPGQFNKGTPKAFKEAAKGL
ncbi:hypothetical protein H4R20_003187 [Coemansia guatemalensis]|uniref:Uncharacterized protein n=1 Tax=Coemansia guatemalensis TaxID=2761395 RepID=A0A9W8LUA9_9FUNG|nr:hypothetical protein H4R20_003187 [Coemansia guatemalensis]